MLQCQPGGRDRDRHHSREIGFDDWLGIDADLRDLIDAQGNLDIVLDLCEVVYLEEFLRDAGCGHALVTADEDVRVLVAEAARGNEVWVMREIIAAAEIIDPLENPRGVLRGAAGQAECTAGDRRAVPGPG